MAARSNKRVSGPFYKALKDVRAAELLKNRPETKRKGPFYEVERVLSAE